MLEALGERPELGLSGGDAPIRTLTGERFALLSTVIPAAARLGAEELERATRERYLRLLDQASRLGPSHLFRVWNLIPGILEPLGELAHRYLAFNAGRFHAYRQWYGERFYEHVPTASGVGAQGGDLVIHALAAQERCRPLQNPRQRPSHRYSDAYGPCPPCFARAALIWSPANRSWLVAGGTASVRGEETVHPGDLDAQSRETFLNLAALVDVGRGQEAGDIGPGEVMERLDRFRHLRVYFTDAGKRAAISSRIESEFRNLLTVEYLRTELCRSDLLIEIEGVAELESPPRPGPVGTD